jgi:hypothetical protein
MLSSACGRSATEAEIVWTVGGVGLGMLVGQGGAVGLARGRVGVGWVDRVGVDWIEISAVGGLTSEGAGGAALGAWAA